MEEIKLYSKKLFLAPSLNVSIERYNEIDKVKDTIVNITETFLLNKDLTARFVKILIYFYLNFPINNYHQSI